MDRGQLHRTAGRTLLIAVGGAAGATLRHAVGTVVPGMGGTIVANVSGSFLLALLLFEAVRSDVLAGRTRLLLGTGVLSSYTTYSTFALETSRAPLWLGALNVVGSYALGFGAVLVGRRVVRALAATGGADAGGAGR